MRTFRIRPPDVASPPRLAVHDVPASQQTATSSVELPLEVAKTSPFAESPPPRTGTRGRLRIGKVHVDVNIHIARWAATSPRPTPAPE